MIGSSVSLPAVRKQTALFGFILLGWAFTSSEVLLDAPKEVSASCGENLTLTCKTSSEEKDIKMFSFMGNEKVLCDKEYKGSKNECRMESSNGTRNLMITIHNMTISKSGQYLCKLHAANGVLTKLIKVQIKECPVVQSSSIDDKFAVCQFTNVNFLANVHWFVGNTNLSLSADNDVKRQRGGFFNITGSLIQTKAKQRHKCSLWNILENKYVEGQTMYLGSSGCSATTPWALMLTIFLLLKLTL